MQQATVEDAGKTRRQTNGTASEPLHGLNNTRIRLTHATRSCQATGRAAKRECRKDQHKEVKGQETKAEDRHKFYFYIYFSVLHTRHGTAPIPNATWMIYGSTDYKQKKGKSSHHL